MLFECLERFLLVAILTPFINAIERWDTILFTLEMYLG